ncbi:MAG: type II toxin-antitoxin system VapC family toxin [Mesorhizobium sp.]|uniref:hypothetical protein n=1 Tax=unclassified Mesorhizobium TaxID=325217 RepID=UPI0004BBAF13|nr:MULTISPECIES: hypothetical protein [unclassified Mesorhizobium]TIL32252.1 MAG: type II toxin-antitoxin system VapC family toxin [Mesorhizobium sp.]TIL56621.1 MAG: type II toxin-antitoxin system VapC family toxin [Mesorhizobium sp.]TIL86568.1 MAG: type II toxin-antitoxin system VapC family toxin [Mesorhizobium sp.]TIM07357.1 MAG: type II toxin-antitoxin system VapC family toxin [Mesorhizobium sp.]TIM29396.1 MAG: type II toxin-antitoxin system VapC family toxin [Mesorhizobium sp.]
MRFMLDTNIISDMVRNPAGRATSAILRITTLVTANMGEFNRIKGLKVENWLA